MPRTISVNSRLDGNPRYSDADMEPLLQALSKLRDGDFRPNSLEGQGAVATALLLVDQIRERASHHHQEAIRVRKEVSREGRMDERLNAGPGAGSWAATIDAANGLMDAFTGPTVAMAQVVEAVASGDLSRKVELRADGRALRGDMLRMARSVNTMVDQLDTFTAQVTQVAREVGTEGRLGGQAPLRGMSGRWRDVTSAVNTMAGRLTAQVRDIAVVTTAVAKGDLTRKVTVEATGELQELKQTVNTMVDQLSAFADEVTRVAREVGTEGNLGGQANVRGVSGVWKDLTDNVNGMATNLTYQVRNIAQVTTAVAHGDLSKKITVNAQGEILELKDTVNTMVDQLSAFADEVTRVAREVGTEGNLGGQANVRGVSGVWKDLTDNVNGMATNLTYQVRNIAQVTTAVAHGDLTLKIDVDARGEILELKTTINTMVDTLSSFASEVTRVAREVGSEGRLGGQAEVEGVSGTWKSLTESVNELASNLTTQVRAIAEVASGVASGDLTRSITVEARGEVAELKDNVNLMVANLRETTRANQEQDWLKTNLARIGQLMQGQRDLAQVSQLIMNELTPMVGAQHGALYLEADAELVLTAGYGLARDLVGRVRFTTGEGLVGQAAMERRTIHVRSVPDDYLKVRSGLGESAPASVIILPIVFEDRVLGVVELAGFDDFNPVHLAFFDQFTETMAVTINAIIATTRTSSLLEESQRLTQELQERSDELQRQQAELRRSNTELEDKAALLAKQNRAIEIQNFQIEQARRALEERAEQLAVSSRYKSEFLANMSHELRTPLNSLLVLAKLLSENTEGNLTSKQVEFARTIHDSGTDLLQLINDILDLEKVEAGKMDVHPQPLELAALVDYVDATFQPMAADKGLDFDVRIEPGTPETLFTDEQRLEQVLRNLLSNAVKFTADGRAELVIASADAEEVASPALRDAGPLVVFRVIDTGIGIGEDKLQLIFEAFQQADGTTSRRYGGTGLGLSISRNIAHLLGGEIQAESELGAGSVFSLFLPVEYRGTGASEPAAPPFPQPPTPVVEDLSLIPPAEPDEPPAEYLDRVLSGRKVLVVDDDVRNVFALTSVLEGYGMDVLYAEDGQAGIDLLQRNPDVAVVLMDVMMPGLDGYATTEAIRNMPQFAELPIIMITAKVMQGDREAGLEAGASDYVAKPVDVDHLLSVMRTWLQQPEVD
ncbi:hybrid sensor histidine kinase/response regulator [Actinocorallia populi]|uniref:hybrid sensor histidine kinase/response regulator n=1 Tax=Actinocorallia populi TaxID=2079200 RepID=UPI000D095FF0|nr:HAMP domain-containing protein [Actinocorallia populi]